MPQIRVFNPATYPASYTARSYFTEKGGRQMARHRHHHHHHHRHHRHHRHNPFGVRGTVIQDAVMTAAGALGVPYISGMFNLSGWGDVLATAAVSAGVPMIARMVGMGGGTAEEVMKGGMAVSVIKAVNQLGFKTPGLGLYAPSWFGVPTASSQYLRAYNANIGPAPRGQGTLYVPGPGGMLVPAVVAPAGPGGAPAALPAGGPTGGGGALGYHRFRSRYQGNY
jgi:hypothetical protein